MLYDEEEAQQFLQAMGAVPTVIPAHPGWLLVVLTHVSDPIIAHVLDPIIAWGIEPGARRDGPGYGLFWHSPRPITVEGTVNDKQDFAIVGPDGHWISCDRYGTDGVEGAVKALRENGESVQTHSAPGKPAWSWLGSHQLAAMYHAGLVDLCAAMYMLARTCANSDDNYFNGEVTPEPNEVRVPLTVIGAELGVTDEAALRTAFERAIEIGLMSRIGEGRYIVHRCSEADVKARGQDG